MPVQAYFSGLKNMTIRPVVRRTGLSLVFRLAGLITGILTNALLARSLGVTEFGQFGLGLTVLTVITQLSDFGAVQAMTAEARRNPSTAANVAGSGLCIRLATAVLGVAVAIPVGVFAVPNANVLVLVIITACAPLGASAVLIALSNAKLRPEVGSALALGQSVLWLAGVFIVSTAGGANAVQFALAFAITTIIQTVITLVFYGGKSMIGRPTWAMSKLIMHQSWPVGLLGLLVTSYYRVGGVLVIGMAGAHEAGLYTAAYKIVDVAQIIPSLIVVPMLPVLIDAMKRGALELNQLTTVVIRSVLLVAISSGLVLALFSSTIISLIYGTDFEGAAPVLEVLGIAFIGITLGYVGSTICFAVDRVKRQIPFVAALGVVSLSFQPWAIGNWGALGSAYVAAATELVMCVLSLTLCAKPLNLKFSAVVGWRYPVLVIALLATYFVTRGDFMASVFICGGTLLVAIIVLRLVGRNEINLIIRGKHGRS